MRIAPTTIACYLFVLSIDLKRDPITEYGLNSTGTSSRPGSSSAGASFPVCVPSPSSSLSDVAVAQLPHLADDPRVDGGVGGRAGLTRGRATWGGRALTPARQPPRAG